MSKVLDPDLIAARFTAYTVAGRHENALAVVKDQIGHYLDNERLWYLLAEGLANTGDLAESERAVRKALALAPELLPALVLLGEVLRIQERMDEAVGVTHHAAALYPDDATAHIAVAWAHFARQSSATDLGIALQAALNALDLSREYDAAFALAARAADMLGRKGQALSLLRDGLAEHPNSVMLLRAAGTVDGGRRVVGDQAPILRSVLAANPFEDGSAEALHELAFDSLRRLLYLPWLQGILFGLAVGPLLPNRVGAAGLALILTAAAAGIFLLALRRLEGRLPRGYLRGEIRSSPLARTALRLAAAAEAWVAGSTLWVALTGGSQLGAAVLALAALPVVASLQLLGRGEYPALMARWSDADLPARREYWKKRVQVYLSTRRIAWAGLILSIAGLSVAGLSEVEVPAVAGAGLCLASLLWLARAASLAFLQRALGEENPFVVGAVLRSVDGQQEKARRKGKSGAEIYTVRIAVVPLILFLSGGALLVSNALPK